MFDCICAGFFGRIKFLILDIISNAFLMFSAVEKIISLYIRFYITNLVLYNSLQVIIRCFNIGLCIVEDNFSVLVTLNIAV